MGKEKGERIKTAHLRDKVYLERCKELRITHPHLFVYVPKVKVNKGDKVHRYTGVIYEK